MQDAMPIIIKVEISLNRNEQDKAMLLEGQPIGILLFPDRMEIFVNYVYQKERLRIDDETDRELAFLTGNEPKLEVINRFDETVIKKEKIIAISLAYNDHEQLYYISFNSYALPLINVKSVKEGRELKEKLVNWWLDA